MFEGYLTPAFGHPSPREWRGAPVGGCVRDELGLAQPARWEHVR